MQVFHFHRRYQSTLRFIPGKLSICGLSFKWNQDSDASLLRSSELTTPLPDYVFKDVFVTLHPGSALLLRGPNGSGKTTFLRCITGALKAVNGCILWDDVPIYRSSYFDWACGKLQWIAANADGLLETRSIYENLLHYSLLYSHAESVSDSAIEMKQLDYAIDRMGLRSLLYKRISTLSTGQRRRVSLARVLASPTPIWLLDEPSIALDREMVHTLEDLLDEHRQDGGIILVASHVNFRLDHAVSLDFS
jgi:heme exporter protein A